MAYEGFETKDDLSPGETLVMKAIWDYGKDICVQDLITVLKERYGREYARTTVTTFLLRLGNKGFVSTYRVKKNALIHAEKSEQEYRREIALRDMSFWFGGSAAELLSAIHEAGGMNEEEIRKAKEYLSEIAE